MHTAGRRAVLTLATVTLLVASACGCAFHGHHYQTAEESDSQGFTQLLEVATESQAAPRSIKGKIKLNGQFYQTSCQCSDAAMTSSCNPPFRLHVHQEAINQDVGLSKRELRKLLGPPTSFQLREVEKVNFACTDGREGRGILGTPGGDFVEFLSALQLYEFLTNSTFTQPKIKEYLVDWLLMSPAPLYYHTDEQARSLLERNVMINGIRGIVGLDLENPVQEQQSEVLKELIKGAHQGCYVIKALLATPDRFYLRKELIEGLITSLYEVLWDKKRMGPDGPLHKKIDFVILSGTPTEKAWINFRGNYRCEDEHKSPIFTPKGLNDTQVFVNHPEAVGVLRTMMSRYFLTRTPPALVSLPEFLGYLNRQGLFIMEAIAEILAGNRMPFYTVQVE